MGAYPGHYGIIIVIPYPWWLYDVILWMYVHEDSTYSFLSYDIIIMTTDYLQEFLDWMLALFYCKVSKKWTSAEIYLHVNRGNVKVAEKLPRAYFFFFCLTILFAVETSSLCLWASNCMAYVHGPVAVASWTESFYQIINCQITIPYSPKIWPGIKFGGLAV